MKTRITSFLEKAGLTILSCLTLISSVWSQPQCMTDGFSTAAPWTSVGPAPVVGGGVLDFGPSGNSKCAYVYRSLTDDRTHDNFSLSASQSWTVEFAFSPTHPTPTMVPGHHLMSLTSTSDDAYNSCASGTAYGISILDAVDIFYACPSSSGGIATWGLTGCGKKAGVLGTASTPIYFNAINQIGMTFYIRLQCLTSGVCQLSVFTDPAFTTLFAPAQCFNVDPTISNLQYAQAGVIPQGGFYRGLNGTLRNLKVCNNRADMDMDPGVWTQTGTTVAINGTSGCVFNNSVDGADSRVDRSLEALVINSQSWNAQATFKLSSTSYTGPGHDILALSNGAGNNIFPMIVPTQDVIVAALVGTGSSMQMVGRAKQGNVWLNSSVGIPIPTAGTYYILLQRICATQGTISVFSDAAHTLPLTGSPQSFVIPAGLTGLDNLQIGTEQWGSAARKISGSVQDVTIYNTEIDGGVIGHNHSVCYGSAVPVINSVSEATTATCGPLSYYWMQQTPAGSGAWTLIPGASSASYAPAALTISTSYQRFTSSPCINWGSNIVTYTVAPASVSIDISTGVTNGATTMIPLGLLDDTWKIAGLPGNAYPSIPAFSALPYAPCVYPVQVGTNLYWSATPPMSDWISAEMNANQSTSVQLQSATGLSGLQQDYLFEMQFNLPGTYTNLQFNIDGATVDNGLRLYLNDHLEYTLADLTAGYGNPFTYVSTPGVIPVPSTDYSYGPGKNSTNTLIARVDNWGGYSSTGFSGYGGDYSWTGFALKGSITGQCVVSKECHNCSTPQGTLVSETTASRTEHPITYFPNPTTGNITVSNFCNSENCNSTITVFDLLGKVVFERQEVQESQVTIDISDQPNGIYFIKIRSEGAEKIAKIVKN